MGDRERSREAEEGIRIGYIVIKVHNLHLERERERELKSSKQL
jgi:hypothetical protein